MILNYVGPKSEVNYFKNHIIIVLNCSICEIIKYDYLNEVIPSIVYNCQLVSTFLIINMIPITFICQKLFILI